MSTQQSTRTIARADHRAMSNCKIITGDRLHRSVAIVDLSPLCGRLRDESLTGSAVIIENRRPDGQLDVTECSPTTGRIRRGDRAYRISADLVLSWPEA